MTSIRLTAGSLLFAMIFALFPLNWIQADSTFTDTSGYKYEESIEFLADRGIVVGYDDGRFGPDDVLNRVEMLKILMEQDFDDSENLLLNCFDDISTQWFAKYVCKAEQEGIVEGYEGNVFRPSQDISMAEGLKIAIEYFELETLQNQDDKWFEPYVDFAHENNLFSKYAYLPNKNMTRGEMAFLVHQLIIDAEGTQALQNGRQNWSAGCGQMPPATAPNTSVVDGVERSYITEIPSDYSENEPKKIIFAMHGRTNSNAQVQGYYKVEEAAGNAAIMVYPSGLPTNSSPRNWADGGDSASKLRDYAFFDQLLEEFSNNYCIDLDEVYVVGHSLGAWFTNSLACFRGDVIRGVGTIGGSTSVGECAGPVATMIWHNPNDRLAAFSGGELARDQYLRQNQCSNDTISVEPAGGNCVEYQGCYDEAPLVWCPHNVDTAWGGAYYPHTWPNFAGSEIWGFFESL